MGVFILFFFKKESHSATQAVLELMKSYMFLPPTHRDKGMCLHLGFYVVLSFGEPCRKFPKSGVSVYIFISALYRVALVSISLPMFGSCFCQHSLQWMCNETGILFCISIAICASHFLHIFADHLYLFLGNIHNQIPCLCSNFVGEWGTKCLFGLHVLVHRSSVREHRTQTQSSEVGTEAESMEECC